MDVWEVPGGARIAWARVAGAAGTAGSRRAARRAAARDLAAALLRPRWGDAAARVELRRQCPDCGGTDHGAPLLVLPADAPSESPVAPLPRVSVAYAGALVVVGLAPDGATAFGIDAEPDDDATRARAAEALPAVDGAHRAHPSPVAAWTRLEAAAKATGRGLRATPDPAGLRLTTHELPGTGALVSIALAR